MIWPVLIFVALLVLPGALLGWVGGLRAGWALASGPAVTFAVAGLAGWLLGAVDVGYSLITAALVWLALIHVALVWRRFAPARVPPLPRPRTPPMRRPRAGTWGSGRRKVGTGRTAHWWRCRRSVACLRRS